MSNHSATLVGGERLINTHDPELCKGRPCAIHNPSNHSMSEFPQHFRDDRGMVERICPHGIGHPDPDHMSWYASCHTTRETHYEGVHGCDGCCHGSYYHYG